MCTFSHMTHLKNHMACLNNTRGWSYESLHDGFEEDSSKLVLKCLMYKTHRHAYITWYVL